MGREKYVIVPQAEAVRLLSCRSLRVVLLPNVNTIWHFTDCADREGVVCPGFQGSWPAGSGPPDPPSKGRQV